MVKLLLVVVVGTFLSGCLSAVCPLMKCRACKSGYRENGGRCKTCECVDPCEYPKCESGQVCQTIQIMCIKAPCYPLYRCYEPCPQVKCSRQCTSGFRETFEGCPTCECVDPCEYPPCAVDETCESQVVQCFAAPCYNVPSCVKPPTTQVTDTTSRQSSTSFMSA